MCIGPKPKKPKPTEADKQNLRNAENDLAHFRENYAPLEAIARDGTRTRNRDAEAKFFKGRSNADVQQAAAEIRKGNVKHLGQGSAAFAMASGKAEEGLREVGAQANIDANTMADQRHIGRTLDVLKTGRGIARTADAGIDLAADIQTANNISRMRSKAITTQAAMGAVSDIAGGALQGFAYKRSLGQMPQASTTPTPSAWQGEPVTMLSIDPRTRNTA